jgi:hypothetical protein
MGIERNKKTFHVLTVCATVSRKLIYFTLNRLADLSHTVQYTITGFAHLLQKSCLLANFFYHFFCENFIYIEP